MPLVPSPLELIAIRKREPDHTSHLSQKITATITVITLVFAFFYAVAVFWAYHQNRKHPRAFSKVLGARLHRYGPLVYVFLVLIGVVEAATAGWLLMQQADTRTPLPTKQTLIGVRILLGSSLVSLFTSTLNTLFLLHPTLSTHPISSIGSHALSAILTWTLAIAGASRLNAALPALLVGAKCWGLAYCPQLQLLFAMAVLQILTLAFGMAVLTVVAWQALRHPAQ